jgi:hypothetical protein
MLGHEGFSITAGKKTVAMVRLSRGAKSRLRNSDGHRFRARLTGSGVEPRTVLLKLAKQKPKRR